MTVASASVQAHPALPRNGARPHDRRSLLIARSRSSNWVPTRTTCHAAGFSGRAGRSGREPRGGAQLVVGIIIGNRCPTTTAAPSDRATGSVTDAIVGWVTTTSAPSRLLRSDAVAATGSSAKARSIHKVANRLAFRNECRISLVWTGSLSRATGEQSSA